MDVVYVLLSVVFWLCLVGLAKGCDRLGGFAK